MVLYCEICETNEVGCVMKGVHLRMDGKGRQEIMYGMSVEEGRVDVVMGRETREFKWVGQEMESSEWRETLRAHGKAAAVKHAGAREERIGQQKYETHVHGGEDDV